MEDCRPEDGAGEGRKLPEAREQALFLIFLFLFFLGFQEEDVRELIRRPTLSLSHILLLCIPCLLPGARAPAAWPRRRETTRRRRPGGDDVFFFFLKEVEIARRKSLLYLFPSSSFSLSTLSLSLSLSLSAHQLTTLCVDLNLGCQTAGKRAVSPIARKARAPSSGAPIAKKIAAPPTRPWSVRRCGFPSRFWGVSIL